MRADPLLVPSRRSGLDNQYISAFMGKDRSHLARLMDVWTFELGRVGKELVGVPHGDYLTATTLAEFEEMGMGECHALGDASDFGCEQPRHPAFAKVANQGHSDKIKSFAARGTHFSTGAGLIIVATSLYFARSSELQGVISLYEDFKKLPKRVQFCYDKGTTSGSFRTATPYMSFCFTPAFAKQNDAGRKKIQTAEEVVSSRAIARARYVPEIHYARVKCWKLLAPKVPIERAHLMDATWWWALGFSNTFQRYLRPPDDVLSLQQIKRQLNRRRREARARD